MAIWLLRGSNRISRLPITIYSDSQAFIRAFRAQRPSAGYHLIEDSLAWQMTSSGTQAPPGIPIGSSLDG